MSAMGFKLPKGYTGVSTPRVSPNQRALIQQLMSQLSGGSSGATDFMSKLASGDESMFAGRENAALKEFQNKIMPSLSQGFANQGMLGSSAYRGAVADAGAGLTEDLFNQRQDLQHQGVNDLLQLLMGLGNTQLDDYSVYATPKKKKFSWGSMLGGLGGVGSALSKFL